MATFTDLPSDLPRPVDCSGEVLGQEPLDRCEVLPSQILVAQLLRPPGRALGWFNWRSRAESARSVFEPFWRIGFGILVHVRRHVLRAKP
jgi:hypothetical protein